MAEQQANNSGSEPSVPGERSVFAAEGITAPVTTGDNSPISINAPRLEPGSLLAPWQVEVTVPVRRLQLPRAMEFVGRREAINQLDHLLAKNEQVLVRQIVHGMGGVGKTELIRHYAHARQDRYKVAWWITADSPENTQQGFAALAAALHPPIAYLGNTAEAAQWALNWLQAHSGWLLVLDNVEERAYVQPWLDCVAVGHVLITTRRHLYWPQTQALALDVLDRDASVHLISMITSIGEGDQTTDLLAIAEELGHLPLALEQAAAYIRQSRIKPSRYLEQLRAHPMRMYGRSAEGGDAEQTMARLWDTHLAALHEHDQAVHLLRTLACYASDGVPRELLGDDPDDLDIDDALQVLDSYSLITRSGDGHTETVSMHRLLQSVVYNGLDYDDPSNQAARATALSWLAKALPDNPGSDVAGWAQWHALLSNIEALTSRYSQGTEPLQLTELLNQGSIFAFSQGRYETAHKFSRRATDIAEAKLGPTHPLISLLLNHSAIALNKLGRPDEAVLLSEKALTIAESTTSDSFLDANWLLNSHATNLSDVGDLTLARSLYERALTATETSLSESQPNLPSLLGNLAITLGKLGHHNKALPLLEQALAITEETNGPDHPDIVIRLGTLAESLHAEGRLLEALRLEKRALAMAERLLGPQHPEVAIRLDNLAVSLRDIGRPSKALPLHRRALAIVETALGPDHPEIAVRLNNLAVTLSALGQATDALPLHQRALNITEQRLGPSHHVTALRLRNLSVTLLSLGRPNEALPFYVRALQIAKSTLGPNHPYTRAWRKEFSMIRRSLKS
ncbi:FxSxx-COOH system tetratricopeptide repeat protein [Nonomuraea angiospora]|uniref:FxSxx-COOH system tetratricopeptide repeat protein n=1 Tax=Nonomuraea angiospora TaxID=46172 RepID=UPI00345106CB